MTTFAEVRTRARPSGNRQGEGAYSKLQEPAIGVHEGRLPGAPHRLRHALARDFPRAKAVRADVAASGVQQRNYAILIACFACEKMPAQMRV